MNHEPEEKMTTSEIESLVIDVLRGRLGREEVRNVEIREGVGGDGDLVIYGSAFHELDATQIDYAKLTNATFEAARQLWERGETRRLHLNHFSAHGNSVGIGGADLDEESDEFIEAPGLGRP